MPAKAPRSRRQAPPAGHVFTLDPLRAGPACLEPRRRAPVAMPALLSSAEVDALAYVAEAGGMADVWSPQLARVLSDLHARCPQLFDRVNSEPDRTGAKPFFGVVLTAAGRAALSEAKGGE